MSQTIRVPIVSGVKASETGEFVTTYPVNREHVLRDIGLAEGYLSAPDGITLKAMGTGEDRGGINWNDVCYRVMGSYLVRVNADWTVDNLGDVGSGGPVRLDYDFDDLIINSGNRLYYWNPVNGLRQVTDPDLGAVVDAVFTDGYTMTTDGEFLVVNDLTNKFAINPLKYGSAEDSPDPVTGLERLRGEVLAFGRYTTQVYQNIGGAGFPFQTVKTATVPYGCVGARAKAKFAGTVAFVGGQERAAIGVYLLTAGDAVKLSPAELDTDLADLTDDELAAVWIEARVRQDDQRLLVHLPKRTWSFSQQVSSKGQVKAWCTYVTSGTPEGRYEGRGHVFCYGQWIVGSSLGEVGVLDSATAKHYGREVCWQFDTTLFYNDGNKAILTGIELIGTPGRGTSDSRVSFSYTKDGEVWSMERFTTAGRNGQHTRKVAWRPGIRFETYMGLRFRGFDGSLMSVARLECDVEPLA